MNNIVLCFLLALFSGYTQAEQPAKIDTPKIYKSSTHTLTIPKSGMIISAPIHIFGKLKITGSGQLQIKHSGRFIVEKNAHLEINGVSILISELSEMDNRDDRRIIRLNGGELILKNNKLTVDVAYNPKNSTSDAPWDEDPGYWVVGSSDLARQKHNPVKISIINNKLENKHPYSVGAIHLSMRTSAKPLNTADLGSMHISGKIIKNQFYGFHGAITIDGGNGVLISGNTLVRNTYANITVAGKNINIIDNEMRYPGNGTTGDGITIDGIMMNSDILGNNIYAGSCYGIWIKASHTRNINIKGNTIINGITSAIYLSNGITKNDSNLKGIVIDDNVMTGNAGFAVAVENSHDIAITNNHFEGNATGFPAQLAKSALAKNVTVRGNISAKKLTPEWAKDLALYRHATSDDNKIFSYTAPPSAP